MRTRAFVVALGALVAMLLAAPGTVRAHTDFESSTPHDGERVSTPVGVVTISFTNPASPVGDGFVVRDADGTRRSPDDVTTIDGRTFELSFDPPLSGGTVGVRWSVQAPDAHPIEGSFSFVVGSAPTTSFPPTTVPPTTVPVTTSPAEVAVSPTTDGVVAVPSSTTAPVATSSPAVEDLTSDLEEFLAVDDDDPGGTVQLVGRIVSLLAAVLALGGMVFLATAFRGSVGELVHGLMAVAIAGGALVVGAIGEYAGLLASSSLGATEAWSSTPGSSMVLRMIGGAAIAFGAGAAARPGTRSELRSLSAGVAAPAPRADVARATDPARWSPGRAPLTVVGAVLVIASFWFDGHTIDRGPRLLHALVDSIHVVAGATWVGGVVAIASLAWSRRRRGRPTGAGVLVVRFSGVATIASIAVIVAGVVMAVMVLDAPGELTSTEWGQVLLLKAAAVALAACAGAYNHFRFRPLAEADPHDEVLADQIRSVVTAEAVLLVFVVVVTAWLVAAAT